MLMKKTAVWRNHLSRYIVPLLLLGCVTGFNLAVLGAGEFPDDQWWDAGFDAKGFDRPPQAVAAYSNTVYVAGDFEYAGTVRARGVARWTGTGWARLGGGVDVGSFGDSVSVLAVDAKNVYAAGQFRWVFQSGGSAVAATNIARWNGSSWSKLGGGIDSGVTALALCNGHLFVGGFFTNAGGLGIQNLARWDGTNWSAVGGGINGWVLRMAVVENSLFVVGYFTMAGGIAVNNLARWDGTNWSALPVLPPFGIRDLSARGSELLVTGVTGHEPGSGWVSAMYRWTGSNWLPVVTNIVGEVVDIAVGTNALYITGNISSVEGVPVNGVARGNECGWMGLGSGIQGPVTDLVAAGTSLYAIGSFSYAGQKPSRNIARWNAGALPRVEIQPSGIVEGSASNSYAVFTLNICPPVSREMVVSYVTSNGTALAGIDYASASGSIKFTPSSSFQAVAVPVFGDRLYEPDESFYLTLSSTGGIAFAQIAAVGTIFNDDASPSISIGDATVTEGDFGTNLLAIDISLSSAMETPVSVYFRLVEGSAKNGSDFVPFRSVDYFGRTRVSFPSGTTNQIVEFGVLTDTFLEPDKEFYLQFGGSEPRLPSAKTNGIGRILNDDLKPVLAFSPFNSDQLNVYEGNARRTHDFILTLSGPIPEAVSVDFSTSENTAVAGSDYLSAAGRCIFQPGVTTQYVSVPILGDIYFEPTEYFSLRLFNPTNATLLSTQVTVSIINEDSLELAPELALSLVVSNLTRPTRMQFSPDGRLFVCEQDGLLRIVRDGRLLPNSFLQVFPEASSETEAGLLGVAFDPGFATNQFVYVFYTARTPANSPVPDGRLRNRVSRFKALGDLTEPGSEVVLFELGDVPNSYFHNGGDLQFGPDGKLYISTGDNYYNRANAQALTNLFGKILRLNADGSIPTDNPFYDSAVGANRAIWAFGFRNPFSFSFQPATGRMLINDVGEAVWEEINEGQKGGNFGWPIFEGPSTNTAFRTPLYSYGPPSPTERAAITAGVFYDPTTLHFPSGYGGSYFFADLYRGIRRLTFTNGLAVHDFVRSMGAIDMKVSPGGQLYTMDRPSFSQGRIWRFESFAVQPVFESIEVLADGQIELVLKVGSERSYFLESSGDLVQWSTLKGFRSSARRYVFREDSPLEPRFYRLRE